MPVPKWASILGVFLIVFLALFQSILVGPAYAITCLFYGNDIVVPLLGTTTASLTVTNSGPETASAVKFVNADGPGFFQITGGSASGWTANLEGEGIIFTGGVLGASQGASFSVQIEGLAETGGSYYTVDASVSTDGSVMQGCSGGRNVSVETFFTIQNLTVSASSTSATISWNTSSSANSSVKYGTTPSYGKTASNGSLVTSHKIVLTGLATGKTYYYSVTSVDGAGHAVETGRNTFKTTSSISTSTPPPALNPAETVPPNVSLTTSFSKPFETAPKIEGKASDNKIIAKIEYSTDGGANWLPVDVIAKPNSKSTTFEFTPEFFEDGNYEIVARAEDSSGNRGSSKEDTLVIDRLPPLVGGSLLSLGPLIMTPDDSGVIVTTAGIGQKISLSATGGPTSIDLYADNQVFSLVRSRENGLWSGIINFQEAGFYRLLARAVDGAGNRTERELSSIAVVEPGRALDSSVNPIGGVSITLFFQEPESKLWAVWDGRPFSQENPQKTDRDGRYQFFLPPGSYYLTAEASGFAPLVSQIFSKEKPTPISSVLTFRPLRKIRLGPWEFSLPSLGAETVRLPLSIPPFPEIPGGSNLVDKEAPLFDLPTGEGSSFSPTERRGKKSLIVFANAWSPPALEQILVLDKMVKERNLAVVVVMVQETPARASVFKKRGGYEVPMVADQYGSLVEAYGLSHLPASYFLDRKGIVREVVSGVLDEDQITEALEF